MRWKSCTLCVAILLLGVSGAAVADWDPDPAGVPATRTKWVQLPDLSRTGIDIKGDLEPEPRALVLADDWLCTRRGPVWDVHLWGSWFHDVPGEVQSINLKIYSDIPAEQNPFGYSMPGELLWDGQFSPMPNPQYDGYFTSRIYAKVPEGDGYLAAIINFRYIANAVWSTDEAVKRISSG